MFMPLTPYQGARNDVWGQTGIPDAYPIGMNKLGAWKDYVPTLLPPKGKGQRTEYFVRLAATAAVLYTAYRLFKGTKHVAREAHYRVKSGIERLGKKRSAKAKAAAAAKAAYDKAFNEEFGGPKSFRVGE